MKVLKLSKRYFFAIRLAQNCCKYSKLLVWYWRVGSGSATETGAIYDLSPGPPGGLVFVDVFLTF